VALIVSKKNFFLAGPISNELWGIGARALCLFFEKLAFI
jgi:hypothetical protein